MCHWMGSNCFTTGLTIMGLHFYKSYLNGVAHFQDFRGQKIQVGRDLKKQKTFSWINASLLFRVTKLKGFITGRCIYINRKWQGWDCKNHFFRYIIGHRIDYNRELVLRGQRHTGLIGFLKRDYHIIRSPSNDRLLILPAWVKSVQKNKNRTTIKKITVQIKKKKNMEKELVSETGNQFQIFGPR